MKASRLSLVALCAALALPPPVPAQAQARRPVPQRAPVTVNFVNADIEAVTRAFAAMIGRQIQVDPRVKGQVTVYSEQPQSVPEAYNGYLTALRGLGFAVVESGGLLKVVPEADAKLQTGTVAVNQVPQRGDQVITQIFQLRYENPNNLVAVLRPLISANNTINANPGSNALVITDYADNLTRLAKIIAALDQPASTDLEVIPLVHAVAVDLAPLVQRLSDGTAGGGVPGVPGAAGAGGATSIVADARSNSLIVRAPNAARLATIRSTIAKLDRPSSGIGPNGGLWVVHLKNAEAVKLAIVLRSAFGTTSGAGGGAGAFGTPTAGQVTSPITTAGGSSPGTSNVGGFGGSSAQATSPVTGSGLPTTGGFIQADPATNSLIITAPEPLYRQVRAMIDQLDSRRAQVYIESLIVEVTGDNLAEFGFQWQGLLGNNGDRFLGFGGTNFSTGGTPNIVTGTAALIGGDGSNIGSAVGTGLNIALLKNYGGVYALAAIARLLQSTAQTNIVSTPNLITLDNEEAKIVVGQNVPFVTGQFTNTGTATTSPFQTIERKDVGTTLRIRPQIGEGGTIRMTIYQEQSAVLGTAIGTTNVGPSTSKRSIESQVVVDDGQIIVLGGLIEDNFVENKTQVPILGDIPYLGALFRSESRTKRRSNLMIFLRPVVMYDADSTQKLSVDRYDLIRGQQQAAQPQKSLLLPIGESPVLPPAVKPSADAAPQPLNPPPSKETSAQPRVPLPVPLPSPVPSPVPSGTEVAP